MLPRLFKIFCVALSVTACNGLVVDVCISSPDSGGLVCVDKKQNQYFKPYSETENYVAFSPDDAEKLIDSCKLK